MTFKLLTLLGLFVGEYFCIKVLESIPGTYTGNARVPDIDLQNHLELSICVRFKTPHFDLSEPESFPRLAASVIDLNTLQPLSLWTATWCEDMFSGCTLAKEMTAGQSYIRIDY